MSSRQASNIVAVCPDCHRHSFPSLAGGVNPRGLQSLEIWQTDVTHFPEFGRLKYIHSSIDTFSGALFASCHTGESAKDVCRHFASAFGVLGIPSQIKTDNGPAYISQRIANFLALWGVIHKMGIPHSSTGQAIIERAHSSLKHLLLQQKGGMGNATPAEHLQKALYVFNFLNCSLMDPNPPIVRHFGSNRQLEVKQKALVLVNDPETGKILGPYPLITWGRGFSCVSTENGPRWIPAKSVRPFRESLKISPEDFEDLDHPGTLSAETPAIPASASAPETTEDTSP